MLQGIRATAAPLTGDQEFLMEDELLPKPEYEHPTRDVVIILAVFFEFGLASLSLILGWLLGRPPLEKFQWSSNGAAWGILATIPLIMMFVVMLRWPIGPLARVKEFCDNEVVPLMKGSALSDLALISLSTGLGEEMLFRGVIQAAITGWLQSSLGDWWGVPCGIGLASLIFGICHPFSLPYAVSAAILGVYLGTVWILTGNLLTVMITYALSDFAALTYLLRIRPSPGLDDTSK
jgi:membrane protease YdiL (CAAX protease family)